MHQVTYILLIISLSCAKILAQESARGNPMQRLESLFYCKYDADCPENSFCYGNDEVTVGKCRCKDTYVMLERNRTHIECLPYAQGPNTPCLKDLQCQINMGILASCKEGDNVCQCNDGSHVASDNRCYRTTRIDELCESNYNCLLEDGTYGFCVAGKCSCNTNHHVSQDGKSCVQSALLGDSCPKGESCLINFSDCYGGICKCSTNYIESTNNTLCLEIRNIGDDCIESLQCGAYISDSYCVDNKCSCRRGYHKYGNQCIIDATLGARCFHHKECILSAELQHSVSCDDGICQCIKGTSDGNNYGCEVVNSTKQTMPNILLFLFTLTTTIKIYY